MGEATANYTQLFRMKLGNFQIQTTHLFSNSRNFDIQLLVGSYLRGVYNQDRLSVDTERQLDFQDNEPTISCLKLSFESLTAASTKLRVVNSVEVIQSSFRSSHLSSKLINHD